jgi:hypothetical protein
MDEAPAPQDYWAVLAFSRALSDLTTGALSTFEFLDEGGRYAIASNDSVRIYQLGDQAPIESAGFGGPDGSKESSIYSFLNISSDGGTVLYTDKDGIGGPLNLDPPRGSAIFVGSSATAIHGRRTS